MWFGVWSNKEQGVEEEKATEVEDNRRQKSEEKQIRENEDKLRGLESCEALVRSVLTLGNLDNIERRKNMAKSEGPNSDCNIEFFL